MKMLPIINTVVSGLAVAILLTACSEQPSDDDPSTAPSTPKNQLHKARTISREKACHNNMRIINGAKEQWAMDNGKMDGDIVTESNVINYINSDFQSLACPEGGTYTLGPIGTSPECSEHVSR